MLKLNLENNKNILGVNKMKCSETIIGIMIIIGSYFWYQYAFWNQDVFKYIIFGANPLMGETALPLIVGFIGLIIFIAGVFEK